MKENFKIVDKNRLTPDYQREIIKLKPNLKRRLEN